MRLSSFAFLPAVVLLLVIAGCGSAPRPEQPPANGLDPLPADARARDAEIAIAQLDRALGTARSLAPAVALERQRGMKAQVDATVERCTGTRFENKAVYIQAQWEFNFDDSGAGIDAALDRLDGLEKPLLKQAGRALRVQHQLRQGRIVTARSKAEQVAADVPEFAFLLDLVRWHERIGGPVDATGGPGLDGQPTDPATTEEAHLLYLTLSVWNEQSAFTVQRYREALAALPKADCRLVLVIGDGAPRRIREDLAALPDHVPTTVLLARSIAEARTLNETWKPPMDGFTVLLGPKRLVTAVEVRPGDLPVALGLVQ